MGGSVEKPTNQGREPTITATNAYDQIQESNPGHSIGRLMCSLLRIRHPRSENHRDAQEDYLFQSQTICTLESLAGV